MTVPIDRPGFELDPTAAQRAELAAASLELLEHVLARCESGPVLRPTPPQRIEAMLAPPPEAGRAPALLLERLQAAADCGTSKLHGGDLGYIPSAGLYSGAIAALLASGLHVYTGAAFEAPALVALEESVLRWLAGIIGMPPEAEGVLLSGGSLANQTAIVCAREHGAFDPARSRAYLPANAHHSISKALRMSGIAERCVRRVPIDRRTRVDADALRLQLERDRADGLHPWLITATAGSTDTGAVDELETLAALAGGCGAWLHVDAAYGGAFALTGRGAQRLAGLARADSVTIDAHKGLQLPYGVGALLVRRPGALARAHEGAGAYMRDVVRLPGVPNYFERGPELTRPFRGLLLWLPLHLHGVARFREFLDRSLDLAARAAAELRTVPGIEVLLEPDLSIVVFRATAGDAATAAMRAALDASGQVRVSTTSLGGRSAIRLAFLHVRTGETELETVMRITRAAAAAA